MTPRSLQRTAQRPSVVSNVASVVVVVSLSCHHLVKHRSCWLGCREWSAGMRTSTVKKGKEWLARQDSNLEPPDPESGALPLSHAPAAAAHSTPAASWVLLHLLGSDRSSRPRSRRLHALSREADPCPGALSVRQGRLASLFDSQSKDVKIHGYWLAFPQHTTYLVVETDDIAKLQKFLSPGVNITTSEITPVSDKPAPPPSALTTGPVARASRAGDHRRAVGVRYSPPS